MVTHQERTSTDVPHLPFFAASPVVEVALGVAFQPIAKLRMIELVRLWDALFHSRFPRGEEQPPYLMPIEQFGDRPPLRPALQLLQGFPVPRLWLFDQDSDPSTQVIQLQNNYFARNWRKAPGAAYPRFPALRDPFEQDLESLQRYLQTRKLGELIPIQCELSYISHIDVPAGNADLSEVVSLLAPRPTSGTRAWPEPESIRLATQFLIHHEDAPVGRLYVSADPAVRREDNAPIVLLNVTARGIPLGDGLQGVIDFLGLAHERTVATFESITTSEMHTRWGKSNDG